MTHELRYQIIANKIQQTMPAEYFPKIAKNFRAYEKFRKRKKPAQADKLILQEEKSKIGQKNRLRCTGELRIDGGLDGKIGRVLPTCLIDPTLHLRS